jgi:hypothetical protein
MKRPSFQFYPADWKGNANLRRCSKGARGDWMDILCVLHDSDQYGVVRWPLADLVNAAGADMKLVRELVSKGVLKGAESGPVFFAHTPRHAGKDGEPVTLIEGEGPIWFSSRMVTDEWRRSVSGGKTRFGATTPDTMPRQGERQGTDLGGGATTSSPSSPSKEIEINRFVVGRKSGVIPMTDQNKIALFQSWLADLIGKDGWRIVGEAADPESPNYEQALAFCKDRARAGGKGWPHKWPMPGVVAA